ncbi:porin [Caldimonas thermodepolymerans]|uniref:Porin n=1 Tax=Caldimonas thermodepolymerans TaxID=215580 RepID=A0AA46HUU8_9BURK|nr:porin [Caldimonas thermodepolymerans]TCP04841.1 putative porin [Caldimonas thermodepolymerans]UZG47501.1 porin [Caldimonas thermodepolymerans]
MKKSLLALAVLGAFAGAASAQSNVTLYGRVDLSIARNIGTDHWVMQNGSGSRLGVRGAEDLGGGLKAIFNVEHRFEADSGTLTNANKFWHGRSIVGLAGDSWGQIHLGREYSPAFLYVSLLADPWGYDTVAAHLNLSGAGNLPTRKDNTINYSSPDISGFRAHFQWAMDEVPGNDSNGDWALALTYSAGPLWVGFGYDRTDSRAGGFEKGDWAILSAAYDFGSFKLIGALAQGDQPGTGDKIRDYHIAATAPIGGGELRAAFNKLENKDASGDAEDLSTRFALGYHYPLSKRTTVYVDFARDGEVDDNKWGADFGIKHNF